MKKRIISILLCACMLVTCILPVMSNAEESSSGTSQIMPRLTYIISATCTLAVDSNANSLTALCDLQGYPEVTKLYVRYTFQKKGFLGLSWSDEYTGTYSVSGEDWLVLNRTFTGFSNGTYRLKAEFSAYYYDQCETITVYSAEKKLS